MDDKYMSLRELAEYSSLSVSTLRSFLVEYPDPLPCRTVKRKIVVKMSEFDRWFMRKKHQVERFPSNVVKFGDKILGLA